MTGSGLWRPNRTRILRLIGAGIAALVVLAAPWVSAQNACDDRFAWTCQPATPPSPPPAAADPAVTLPAPAVQAPPVAPQKPATAPRRARNAADPPTAFSAPNPDLRREPATGSLRPAARQPAPGAGALGAAERAFGPLPGEAIFAPFLAPVPSELRAYRPGGADPPAAPRSPSVAAGDGRGGGAAETAPPPRPTPVRVSRVTPVEDPPLMTPLRWLFVAWGGALALGSTIRMLF
jgi:hypothetical protein